MTLGTWLTVVTICALGAMSPGPSLAVVLRLTLSGGRRNGCIAALTHAGGIGLYALLSISGIAFLIVASPVLFTAFRWAGAAYLAWLGYRGLTAKPHEDGKPAPAASSGNAARDGFLIVFLNPKIAVFFIALFSQVIGADTSLPARLGYATTAMVIDALWYLLVAWLFSSPLWLHKLQARAVWFERIFGVVLLALAGRLLYQTLVAA